MAKNSPLTLVDPASTIAPPPANLGAAGTKLWQSIMTDYDISDSDGLALLEQVALSAPSGCGLRLTRMARLSATETACGSILDCGVN
jgi:hypothetical protein